MLQRKRNYYTAIGSLALVVGITLRLWMHGIYVDFLSGFAMGLAIVLLIVGVMRSRSDAAHDCGRR